MKQFPKTQLILVRMEWDHPNLHVCERWKRGMWGWKESAGLSVSLKRKGVMCCCLFYSFTLWREWECWWFGFSVAYSWLWWCWLFQELFVVYIQGERKCDAAHVKSEDATTSLLSSFLLSNEWTMCINEGGVDYDWNECVKERRKERYCWRAGVMSRNEREEEEELLVWTVFFLLLKARSSLRVTVAREGMSVCEERVIRNTLQSDDTRIAEWPTVFYSCEWSEFRHVYSSVPIIILTSHCQFTWVSFRNNKCIIAKSNGSQFRQV